MASSSSSPDIVVLVWSCPPPPPLLFACGAVPSSSHVVVVSSLAIFPPPPLLSSCVWSRPHPHPRRRRRRVVACLPCFLPPPSGDQFVPSSTSPVVVGCVRLLHPRHRCLGGPVLPRRRPLLSCVVGWFLFLFPPPPPSPSSSGGFLSCFLQLHLLPIVVPSPSRLVAPVRLSPPPPPSSS